MNRLTDDNHDAFTITFRREIIFYLRQLINDGQQISAIFNEGRDTILTVLLDVNEAKDTLTFDWGSSEEINRRFLASERNFFVATPQGIRNQFLCGKPRQTTYKKHPAFEVRLPKKYVRLQRREYFRLVLPMTLRPKCSFPAPDGSTLEAAVLDVGLGGVALEVAAASVPLEAGMTIGNVRIELSNFGEFNVAFQVRHIGQATRGAKQITRLGCQFEKLARAQEQVLQKFITQVQRDERARLGI